MTTVKKLSVALAGAALIALGIGGEAQAAKITADATGLDSGLNAALDRNNFFGVSFDEGVAGTFIKSFTFDLSPDTNAFFDLTNGNPGGLGFPFALGTSSGISASDISVAVSANRKSLTATLIDGAFVAGDFLRFGVDTDNVGLSFFGIDLLDPGVDFGLADVLFSANLSNGTSGSAAFSIASLLPSRSVATVNIADPIAVPEPASVLGLLAVGVGAGSVLKRKQQKA